MRRNIVAGNWKMNLTVNEVIDLISGIEDHPTFQSITTSQLILAPPFPYLDLVKSMTDDQSNVFLAAQNCHHENAGAYTGEVSAAMLHSLGVDYVLIGHSERRQYFEETNEQLKRKVNQALENELQPIYCCGEQLHEREKALHELVVKEQLNEALFHLNENQFKQITIAYEPVWAIGTGVTATASQAQEMHAFIRKTIAEHFDDKLASITSILYGGSCKPTNAAELFSQPDVDGGLIGGASLKANDFVEIALAMEEAKPA